LTGATVGARLVLEQLPRVQQLLESSDASVEAIAAVVGLAWPRRYAGISQMRFAHRPLHGGANFAWRQRGGECDGRSRMIALHAVRLETASAVGDQNRYRGRAMHGTPGAAFDSRSAQATKPLTTITALAPAESAKLAAHRRQRFVLSGAIS
jgi:hypothetical protein